MYKFKNPETVSLNYDGRVIWAHDLTDELIDSMKEKMPGILDIVEPAPPAKESAPKGKAQPPKE